MPFDENDAYAQAKVKEFLESLTDLSAAEKLEARYAFSRLRDAVGRDMDPVWRKINRGEVRFDVLSSSAALLTVYFKEIQAAIEGRTDF